MTLYRQILRPLLFQLPAEAAHNLARWSLRSEAPWKYGASRWQVKSPVLRTQLGKLEVENPVGLAPGLDKNGEMISALQHFGFGYLCIGSILPVPQPGNPRPRVLRYPEEQALINCYGLPSHGLAAVAERLRRIRSRVPIVATVDGPNVEEYLRSFAAMEPLVDAIQVSAKCPNHTKDEGDFLLLSNWDQLLQQVMARKRKPVFVRLTPWQSEQELQARLELVERAVFYGADAITMAGTITKQEPRLSIGHGQVSGPPALERTLRTVREMYAITQGRVAIKALGGISSGDDAFRAFQAGATTVELLTAFVYQGPSIARRINTELIALCRRHGITNLAQLRPQPARKAGKARRASVR